jgi:multiple sugar transport system substrate-binding protein
MLLRRLNRRHFLGFSATVGIGTALAACGATPQPAAKATDTPVPAQAATSAPEATATAPAAAEATATPAPAAATPASAGGKTTVTIFVGMGTGTAPDQQTAQNALADQWNAAHDDIKIEYMYVPYEESRTKWSAMLAAGTPPAINMPSGVEQVGRFRDTNLDIGPYIDRDKVDLSDFGDLIPEVGKYQGVRYGIVMGVYPSVLYYNENIFDTAGVDYPPHAWGTADWNFDAMVQSAKKLSLDSAGKDASAADFDPSKQNQWGYDEIDCGLSINGLALEWGAKNMGWSDDFHTLYFNQQAWVDRLQWVSDAIWKWHIMPSAEQTTAASPGFNTGKLGIDHCHSWRLGEMQELSFRWNVGAVPAGPTGILKAQCDVDGFLICNKFPNLDAAWEVAKWMMQPDQMLKLDLTWGALPPRFSLQQTYKDQMKAKYPELDLQVFFDSLKYIDVPNHETYFPRWGEVWDAYATGLQKILTGDEKNAKVVLDEVQKICQGYLDEYWAHPS